MGIQISCDFCGRELVYSRGWRHAENSTIECTTCGEIREQIAKLRTLTNNLAIAHTVMVNSDARKEETKTAQNLCKRLTEILEKVMIADEPVL